MTSSITFIAGQGTLKCAFEMDLRLFFHNNYNRSKFLFPSDGLLGSLPIFLHVLSLVLFFWDPTNRDSYLGHANWPIGG